MSENKCIEMGRGYRFERFFRGARGRKWALKSVNTLKNGN